MRGWIRVLAPMSCVLAAGGCAHYRAYPGPARPASEIARLTIAAGGLRVDGDPVDAGVHRIELLPGAHRLEWAYRYPNGYTQQHAMDFEAAGGLRYRFGQRFFPAPNPAGPIGEIVDLVIGTASAPIDVLLAAEPADGPPEGEYFSWLLEHESGRVVAGLAPDVPLEHPPITYVGAGDVDR